MGGRGTRAGGLSGPQALKPGHLAEVRHRPPVLDPTTPSLPIQGSGRPHRTSGKS